MITHEITLEMSKSLAPRLDNSVVLRQGDADTQKIVASIVSGGSPYEPPYGSARLEMQYGNGAWAYVEAEISGSIVSVVLPSAAVSNPGKCRMAYFRFYSGEEMESTEDFLVFILRSAGDGAKAGNYSDEVDALLKKWAELEGLAERQESARVKTEELRASNEETRSKNESARIAAEAERAAAEKERTASEAQRKDNEAARQETAAAMSEATDAANLAASDASTAATRANDAAATAEGAADSGVLLTVKDYRGSMALYQIISD